MKPFEGKRLMLLGGSKPYVKIAKAAKELGAVLIVVDKNATEEILTFADEYVKLSLLEKKDIEKWCEEHPVDGILNLCVDFAQRTHQELCDRFGLPCGFNQQQIDVLANKTLFKETLKECGLDIIQTYTEQDVIDDQVTYPIIIKPSEGSGSRGSLTCFNRSNAIEGIKKAKQESRNGDIVIEEFIQNAQEVQITYFLCNGELYVIRTADSYEGKKENSMERVVACAISPSKYTAKYFENTHSLVFKMVKKLGLHDGPFFMQGFYHDGKFKFFDPGARFPGVDFDSIYAIEYDINIPEMMVSYALSGKMPNALIPDDMYKLNGKKAAVLFPVMRAGVIADVKGIDTIRKASSVFSVSSRHLIGDVIEYTYDVNQRYGEFDIIAGNIEELKKEITFVQSTLSILDENANEMLYSTFDVNRIDHNTI